MKWSLVPGRSDPFICPFCEHELAEGHEYTGLMGHVENQWLCTNNTCQRQVEILLTFKL